MKKKTEKNWQDGHETHLSQVIESPNKEQTEKQILKTWEKLGFENAIPEPINSQSGLRGQVTEATQPLMQPNTFIPPNIGIAPYSSICKVYYTRGGIPYVASGWIVIGNTGVKGIITSGHVVYNNGQWSQNYVVRRQYSNGYYPEQFTGNFARTLNGWIQRYYPREFYDIGAIIPTSAVSSATPALPIVYNYNPYTSPYNYYYDVGYPAKPANGYPFNGEIMWESDGSLISVHSNDGKNVLKAYNTMEQGSSGSPWLIYNPFNGQHYVAGVQTSGWDGTPSSHSPYFETRNIVSLLRDIGVMS